MLQNKFEMPLDLKINDSKIFLFYLSLIFLLAFISILISALVLSLKIFLSVILLCTAFLYLNRRSKNKATLLKLSKDDKWRLEIDSKQSFGVELQGECIVTFFLVWLNFTSDTNFGRKKQFHVLLLPDSADKDLLRKLRVRLRFLSNSKEDKVDVEAV